MCYLIYLIFQGMLVLPHEGRRSGRRLRETPELRREQVGSFELRSLERGSLRNSFRGPGQRRDRSQERRQLDLQGLRAVGGDGQVFQEQVHQLLPCRVRYQRPRHVLQKQVGLLLPAYSQR